MHVLGCARVSEYTSSQKKGRQENREESHLLVCAAFHKKRGNSPYSTMQGNKRDELAEDNQSQSAVLKEF